MLKLLLGCLEGLALLSLVGLGPSLALGRRAGLALSERLALAPVLGAALAVALLGMAASTGKAVGPWAWPLTLILLGQSAWLAFLERRAPWASLGRRAWLPLVAALGALLLLMAPALAGGLRTSLGGLFPVDGCNYNSIALCLFEQGVDYFNTHLPPEVLRDHMPLVKGGIMLVDRWGVSLLLGWQSLLLGLFGLHLLHYLGLQALAASQGLVYVLMRRLGQPRLRSALAGLVFAGNFWVLLSLDLLAFSYLWALPLALALLLLGIHRLEEGKGSWAAGTLAALLLHCLVMVYVEMLPLVLAAWACGLLASQRRARLAAEAGAILLAALLLNPPGILHHLMFLARQVHNHTPENFEDMWRAFSFLGERPHWHLLPRAAWGTLPVSGPLASGLPAAWDVAGLALLALLALKLWGQGIKARPALLLLPAAGLASLAVGLACLAKGIMWVGGKELSYGGPFLMLALLVDMPWKKRDWLGAEMALRWGPWLLLLAALWSCGLRFGNAALEKEFWAPYPRMFRFSLDARLGGDELDPIQQALAKDPGLLLLQVADREIDLDYCLQRFEPHPMLAPGLLYKAWEIAPDPSDYLQDSAAPPELLLADDQSFRPEILRQLPPPVAASRHFALYDLRQGGLEAFAAAIGRQSGIWGWRHKMPGEAMEWRFVATGRSAYKLRWAPGTRGRFLLNGASCEMRALSFTPRPGINRILVAPQDWGYPSFQLLPLPSQGRP
jgi:hypothetical protein